MSDSQNVRWEYTVFYIDDNPINYEEDDERKAFNKKFNKLGQEGWELVVSCGHDQCFIFKRKLP